MDKNQHQQLLNKLTAIEHLLSEINKKLDEPLCTVGTAQYFITPAREKRCICDSGQGYNTHQRPCPVHG